MTCISRVCTFRSVLAALVAGASLALSAVPSQAQTASAVPNAIKVRLDQARIFKLDTPASAIIIGNPAIADAAVHDGKTVIITGKSYGVTNIIIMDRNNVVVDERHIHVQAPEAAVLSVQRGAEHETYSCTPDCKQAPMVGDTPKFFEQTMGQTSARNSLAQSQSAR